MRLNLSSLSIPRDDDEITDEEKLFRKWLSRVYRYLLATFISYELFDFLFSPLWMHGYLWSLNQQVDVDLADKSAGFIIDRQLGKVPTVERIFHSALSVFGICSILCCSGYFNKNKTIWHLFGLSLLSGGIAGLIRCQQMDQRLYSVLHESFYSYFNFFITSCIMTLRFAEKTCDDKYSDKNPVNKADDLDKNEPTANINEKCEVLEKNNYNSVK